MSEAVKLSTLEGIGVVPFRAEDWLPNDFEQVEDHQTALPRIAKDTALTAKIEQILPQIPTRHDLFHADARSLGSIAPNSVHLVVTSPPYWTLKDYRDHPDQLGCVADYAAFLDELDRLWRGCYRALVPGGRLVCVVGHVCLSRRKNGGEHTVVPLHSARALMPAGPLAPSPRLPRLATWPMRPSGCRSTAPTASAATSPS